MPGWSSDGRLIVFHSRRKSETRGGLATRKIWVMNSDGSEARAISSGPADEYHPSFSPTGPHVLFVSEANGNRDVWVMANEGAPPVPLTDNPGVEDHPAWSPDAQRVVYSAFPKEGGSFDLWVVNSDGSGKHRLTSTAANEIFPAWHPDGETIAYVTDASGNFDIYGIRVRDQTTFPIIASPDHNARPAWSSDGMKIAFARWPVHSRTEHATLWVANSDGTVPIELDVPVGSTHPAWSPDRRRIAFQRRTELGWDIWAYSPPAELVRAGRLHLGQQLRGGTADLVVLRTGDRLTGQVDNARYRLRTAYATLDLPRALVAGLRFGLGRGLIRVILANGDAASGILLDDTVRIVTEGGEHRFGSEQLDSVGLRVPADAPTETGGLRFTMRNGDVLTARVSRSPLRIRVADQVIAVAPSMIVHANMADDGTRLHVELASGETVSGELETTQIELRLAIGSTITVRPGHIRAILGMEKSAPPLQPKTVP
jgi:Tol biopolymer transport system component